MNGWFTPRFNTEERIIEQLDWSTERKKDVKYRNVCQRHMGHGSPRERGHRMEQKQCFWRNMANNFPKVIENIKLWIQKVLQTPKRKNTKKKTHLALRPCFGIPSSTKMTRSPKGMANPRPGARTVQASSDISCQGVRNTSEVRKHQWGGYHWSNWRQLPHQDDSHTTQKTHDTWK